MFFIDYFSRNFSIYNDFFFEDILNHFLTLPCSDYNSLKTLIFFNKLVITFTFYYNLLP